MDELDDYVCPNCGCPNETCHCLEDYNNGVFDDSDDDYYDDEGDYEYEDYICLLNGVPLYLNELDKMLI
jgi:hypothetical protein